MYHLRWNTKTRTSICERASGEGVSVPWIFKIHIRRQRKLCCERCTYAYQMAVKLQAV